MSAIGRIISIPPGYSEYVTVRDEYDNNRSVERREIPSDAEEGDSFAYKIDFFSNTGTMTLKKA